MTRLAALLMVFVLANPVFAETRSAVGGIDHVGLTVTDLAASERFFVGELGFEKVGGDAEYPSVFLSNGAILVTLWRANEPDLAVPFDRKQNVGLHHLAFAVASFSALDALHTRLQHAAGVRIEFAPELLGGGPARHMMIREPSGNRLEFIHRPNADGPTVSPTAFPGSES